MQYEHIIAGTPRPRGAPRASASPAFRQGAPWMAPVTHRFPPVLQVLTRTAPHIEQQLAAIATQAHQQGKTLAEICREIYYYARSLGYHATIGMQEVYSSNMPSFPDQTVISALLMVDLVSLSARPSCRRPMGKAV